MADTYTKARWKEAGTTNYVHPETEVDQLKATNGTALNSVISTLLKATSAANARTAISAAASSHSHASGDITNFASQVVSAIGSETLEALGVRYSITTNGYICFGDLFGGLILQWARLYTDQCTLYDSIYTMPKILECPNRSLGTYYTARGNGVNKIWIAKSWMADVPDIGDVSKTHYAFAVFASDNNFEPVTEGYHWFSVLNICN